MIQVSHVALPETLLNRLKEEAEFADSFGEYTKEKLLGMQQPLAVAVGMIGPVLFAFVYYVAGMQALFHIVWSFSLSSAMFILGSWYVNRGEISGQYARRNKARKAAKANLRVGTGESVILDMKVQPQFYEHEHGVICLADSGDGRTVYFNVDSIENDPRWFLYINGDMHRNSWRWMRLDGSGTVADFQAVGRRMAKIGDTPYVEAPDAWEAIALALNEPSDGEIVDRPLEEVQDVIKRLL